MIKANSLAKVNLLLLCLFATAWAQSESDVQEMERQEYGIPSAPARSATPPPAAEPITPQQPKLDDVQPDALPEKVSSIEAEEFKVRALKSSTSKRVWLLEDHTENRPKPGKVLLLKDGDQDIAAIRVLRNYPGKFAAKIILPFSSPQTGREYRTLKKLGDKIIEMIKERERNAKDLDSGRTDEDLAREVAPDDNELDRGIPTPKQPTKPAKKSPQRKAAPQQSQSSKVSPLFTREGEELEPDAVELKDTDDEEELSVKDDGVLERDNHAISAQYASIASVERDGTAANRSAAGLRYGYNFARKLIFKKSTFQDMLTAELGFFVITSVNFSNPQESFSINSFILTGRYNLLVGETLTFYAYLGVMKPFASADQAQIEKPGSTSPAVFSRAKLSLGIGTMIEIGPSWAARLDFGTDLFAIGAVLKF